MQNTEKIVVILGTGGTIAGTAADPGDSVGYTAAQRTVTQLLDGLSTPPGCRPQPARPAAA